MLPNITRVKKSLRVCVLMYKLPCKLKFPHAFLTALLYDPTMSKVRRQNFSSSLSFLNCFSTDWVTSGKLKEVWKNTLYPYRSPRDVSVLHYIIAHLRSEIVFLRHEMSLTDLTPTEAFMTSPEGMGVFELFGLCVVLRGFWLVGGFQSAFVFLLCRRAKSQKPKGK